MIFIDGRKFKPDMADINRYLELNNGYKMPMVGYGTFNPKPEEEQILFDSIVYAVEEGGYRHIDTASFYKNEHIIGEALNEGFEKGVKINDMFITAKLWRDDFNDVEVAINASLSELQLEYLDLYLIHLLGPAIDWENFEVIGPPFIMFGKTWKHLLRKN